IACRRNLGIQFGDVKNPPARTTDVFISVAMEIVHDLLDASIRADLQNITRCISLGVDIVDSYSGYQMQLVIMSDLTTYKDYITGKSYPTGAEEKTLLPITDYGSHFVTIDDDKILILGCHDLNVFSRRAEANAKGHRTITQKRFKDLVALHLPNIVLQHPHTTDSTRTWLQGINGLLSFDQPIQHFASAGRYYNRYGDCRSTLDSILLSTKKGCVQNIVISNA
ncbi:MAG: hypothetical protein U1C33_01370, partial [Candidatus Cloacimonadaceae bacterium]|nr:hypothetical protein [Candidatus Cloacimonadaceae bacterium]